MANSTRFRSARGGRRRQTSWVDGPNQVANNLSVAGASAWSIGTGTTEDGTTIVRTRGFFTANLIGVTTIGDGYHDFSVGIGITTEEAFTVGGVTSLPSPLSDSNWDGWLFHQHVGNFLGSSVVALGRSPMEAVRIEIDSKAMRKFEDGMVCFGAFELGTEIGTAIMQVAARTRLLVKLP